MKSTCNYAAILACVLTNTNIVSGQNAVDAPAVAAVAAAEGAAAKSKGEANYFNSQSKINDQEAYSRYLQNSQTSIEAYFRNKQVNQEATRPQRLTYEQYAAMAKKYGPEGLSVQQYDRTLGRLNWPAVLGGPEFTAERDALNRLFTDRTPLDVGPGTAFYGHVHRIGDSMDAKLKIKFTDLTAAEYIFATKFIAGLIKESHEPLIISVVASRQPQTAQPILAGQQGLPNGSPTQPPQPPQPPLSVAPRP